MRHIGNQAGNMPYTARAAIIRGFEDLVADLGGDPSEIAERAELGPGILDEPNRQISAHTILNVLDLSATTTNCDHFGLELARRRDLIGYLGVLGEILQVAPTLGVALSKVFELFGIHSEASLWGLNADQETAHITFALMDESSASFKQVQQLVITLLWRLTNLLSDCRWNPLVVSFTFAKPKNQRPYRRLFNVPIDFDADYCGISFDASDLKIKLTDSDAARYEWLHHRAQSMHDLRQSDLAEDVRTLIRRNLELQQIGEEYITPHIPFKRRTLQRKLAGHGTSYRELLNEVRINMAIGLLENSEIPITRLSERLCYNDLANFSKAFKKSTGLSPKSWRKRSRSNCSKTLQR